MIVHVRSTVHPSRGGRLYLLKTKVGVITSLTRSLSLTSGVWSVTVRKSTAFKLNKMSLNKLAVDSVDVSGKRVLIRFVFVCLYIVSVEKYQSFLLTLLKFLPVGLDIAIGI